MKDIGESFLLKREEIGLKKEEVATDLCITVAQLDNLENGSINAFKDISFLKELILKYAKYLDLNEEEVLDSFNGFMFDFTSKIPVDKIEEKVKELNKEIKEEDRKRIVSPYTKTVKSKMEKKVINVIVITSLLVMLALVAVFLGFYFIRK
ncbi:MAG: helix-turn-helix domain-containing protein [Bacilli bacterium]